MRLTYPPKTDNPGLDVWLERLVYELEKLTVEDISLLNQDLTTDASPTFADLTLTSGNCRIKTGTYTGDGSEGQAITGVGFTPKYGEVWEHPTAQANQNVYEKLDQTWGDYASEHSVTATSEHRRIANKINSLDADGFTVDDDGANLDPNADTVVYDYLLLG